MEKSIDVKIETSTWQTNVIKRMKERFFFLYTKKFVIT